MKNYLFILLSFIILKGCGQEKSSKDIWSGRYELLITVQGKYQVVDTLEIRKIANAKAEKLAAQYESDLERWTIHSLKEPDEKREVRRFLFDLEDNIDEYESLNWTDLHLQGKINCIDAGNFFICSTTPNTWVNLGEKEKYFTKTGIFGIRLHFGAFELRKIE